MKIIHFADLHLGVEQYGRVDPATGLSTRLGDFLKVLDELVDYALNNDVDLVLCCGDVYHRRDPSQTYQREFAKRIRRLTSNGIAVFLLVGNHDLPSAAGRANSVEIFDALAIDDVYIGSKLATYLVKTKSGALQVLAVPWARRSALLARNDAKNLTFEQLNERIEQTLVASIDEEVSSLRTDLPVIFAAHVADARAVPSSERSMVTTRDYIMHASSVSRPEFDYAALGHMHRNQQLSQLPPTIYPGSLERLDFQDEKHEKGFYVVDLDSSKPIGERLLNYAFHPVSARRFLTIKVDANTDNPTATVLSAIAKKEISDAIVRLIIKVRESNEPLLNNAEIRRVLAGAYYVGAIIKDVDRERRVRIGGENVESMPYTKALELYLQQKNISPKRIKTMVEYAERLILDNDKQAGVSEHL